MGNVIRLEKWSAVGTDSQGIWEEEFLSSPNKKIAKNYLKGLTKDRHMCTVLVLAKSDELTE